MTYQGARAQPIATEVGRFFEVSRVRLGNDGHVSDVTWVEVNAKSDLDVGAEVIAPSSEVIDAIHDGATVTAIFVASEGRTPGSNFVVVENVNGDEMLHLEGPASDGRTLADISRF
jgi:hypothetical protein